MTDAQSASSRSRNRPREALMNALALDLNPMVRDLRELGWPAEVWVVKEDGDVPFHMKVMIPLDGVPQPVENAGPCMAASNNPYREAIVGLIAAIKDDPGWGTTATVNYRMKDRLVALLAGADAQNGGEAK